MSNANPNNLEKLSGLIVRINKGAKPSWCSGMIEVADNQRHSFKGKFLLAEGDIVNLYGRWVDNPGYSQQFDCANFEYNLNPSEQSWAVILEKSPLFEGIGKVRAKKIAKAIIELGDDFDNTLFSNPSKLQSFGLSFPVIETLQKQWENNKQNNIILTELVAFGLSYAKAKRLLEERGDSVISTIRNNPYSLIDLVDGFGFKTVDQVAITMGFALDSAFRIQAGIKFAINQVLGFGNCWIEFDEFIKRLQSSDILGLTGEENKGKIQIQIQVAVEKKTIVIDTIENTGLTVVADKWLYDQEMAIIDIFNNQIYELPHERLLDIFNNMPDDLFHLNEGQKSSIINSLRYNISLTGGYAGTGKTTSIECILHIAAIAGLSTALAAPTGTAAKQMERATGRNDAKTIHRLLEYTSMRSGYIDEDGKEIIVINGFKRNSHNPIEAKIVFIDETSMISIDLMYSLLSAIDFHKTRLIFTGDYNQLPPVGAGSLLRDIVAKKAIPAVILTQVMRNGGDLRKNAENIIKKGKLNPTSDKLCSEVNIRVDRKLLKQWIVVDTHVEPRANENQEIKPKEDILETLRLSFEERLEKYNLDLLKEVQVLSPVHDGRVGTKNLNKVLQKILQKKLYNIDVQIKPFGNAEILIGDKVIQKKNDYGLNIMNGSMGIVLDIERDKNDKPETYIIDFGMNFGQQIVKMTTLDIEYLQLGYCTSIHSSQGKEWPLVITVITKNCSNPLKNKNLLYTAVTRARESSIILTDKEGAKFAASNPEQEKRKTFAQYYLKPFVDRHQRVIAQSVVVEDTKESFPVSVSSFPESEMDENLQVPCTTGVKCSSCNFSIADTTIVENSEKVNLCEGCYWDYLEDHNLDHDLVNPSVTVTTISSPIVTPTVIPTPVTTDLTQEIREKEVVLETLKTIPDSMPEIQSTTNSGVYESPDLEIASKEANSLLSQNLPISNEPQTRKVVKRINLFDDELSENYPFWHDEIVEEIIA